MRISRSRLKGLACLAILVLSLTSCGGDEGKKDDMEVSDSDGSLYCNIARIQKQPLAIPSQTVTVLAPTSNFVDFTTIVSIAETKIKASLGGSLPESQLSQAKGREISVVLADGNPRLIAKRSVQPLGDSTYDITSAIDSSFGIFRLANKCAAGSFKRKKDQIKTYAGTDMLKALSIAADQLTVTGPKKIFVLGNGIQTKGAIQMQEPGAFPKSESSARLLALGLKGIGEIPDLHGAEVSWYGIGEVDGVNQELSEKAANSLESFWKQVIELGHGKVGDFCAQCGAGEPHRNSIAVPYFAVKTCKLVRLYEEDGVEFKPDSAVFVNLSKAKSAAKLMSQQFKGKGCDELEVTGFAAAGVDKATYDAKKSQIDKVNLNLTKKRAEAFARLIRAAGFTGAISSSGGGTCGTEWSASGAVDLDLQRLCRRVEVSN